MAQHCNPHVPNRKVRRAQSRVIALWAPYWYGRGDVGEAKHAYYLATHRRRVRRALDVLGAHGSLHMLANIARGE